MVVPRLLSVLARLYHGLRTSPSYVVLEHLDGTDAGIYGYSLQS